MAHDQPNGVANGHHNTKHLNGHSKNGLDLDEILSFVIDVALQAGEMIKDGQARRGNTCINGQKSNSVDVVLILWELMFSWSRKSIKLLKHSYLMPSVIDTQITYFTVRNRYAKLQKRKNPLLPALFSIA